MFAEADVDLTADDFGELQTHPFPCFEQFILESTTNAGSEPVIDRPLLYFQVDEAQVWRLHLRAASLPLHGGRAGLHAVREGHLRARAGQQRAVCGAGVGAGRSFIVNGRGRAGIPLPEGYYGNAFAYSVAAATAGELCGGGLGHALELVKKAKSAVTHDYLLSVADLMVLTGRPLFALPRTYIGSNVSHAGFKAVDFGCVEAAYGRPAKVGERAVPGVANYFWRSKNGKGEEGIVVPICLPVDAMDKFQLEVQGLTAEL